MNSNQFTEKSLEALQQAEREASGRNHSAVEQVHLLDALGLPAEWALLRGCLKKWACRGLEKDCAAALDETCRS